MLFERLFAAVAAIIAISLACAAASAMPISICCADIAIRLPAADAAFIARAPPLFAAIFAAAISIRQPLCRCCHYCRYYADCHYVFRYAAILFLLPISFAATFIAAFTPPAITFAARRRLRQAFSPIFFSWHSFTSASASRQPPRQPRRRLIFFAFHRRFTPLRHISSFIAIFALPLHMLRFIRQRLPLLFSSGCRHADIEITFAFAMPSFSRFGFFRHEPKR